MLAKVLYDIKQDVFDDKLTFENHEFLTKYSNKHEINMEKLDCYVSLFIKLKEEPLKKTPQGSYYWRESEVDLASLVFHECSDLSKKERFKVIDNLLTHRTEQAITKYYKKGNFKEKNNELQNIYKKYQGNLMRDKTDNIVLGLDRKFDELLNKLKQNKNIVTVPKKKKASEVIHKLKDKVTILEKENENLETKNFKLRERISHLEDSLERASNLMRSALEVFLSLESSNSSNTIYKVNKSGIVETIKKADV